LPARFNIGKVFALLQPRNETFPPRRAELHFAGYGAWKRRKTFLDHSL
jgi:hypothetical protein